MDNFRKNKKTNGRSFGGGRDRKGGFESDRGGRKSFGGGRGGSRPEMHSAVCDDCGKRCEVPFRPTGDKPIFCSDCFRNKDNSKGSRERGRDSGSRFRGKSSYKDNKREAVPNYKDQFEMLNAKLDKIISVLIPSEVKELNGLVETTEVKKTEKKAKKEVNSKALKKAINKTSTKKSPTKRKVAKKKSSK